LTVVSKNFYPPLTMKRKLTIFGTYLFDTAINITQYAEEVRMFETRKNRRCESVPIVSVPYRGLEFIRIL